MIINAVLTNNYGVGSAVIGYLAYVIIQVLFYYFYFIHKILGLKSMRVFKSFIIPTFIGFGIMLLVSFVKLQTSSLILEMIVKTILWIVLYFLLLVAFKIIDIRKMQFDLLHKK